jgi:hypothetical protein
MFNKLKSARTLSIGTAALMAATLFVPAISAQQRPDWDRQQSQRQQRQDWDWDGNYRRVATINAGTFITVKTTQSVRADQEGRVYSAIVDEDVWDDYGRLAVPMIPKGSRVDLTVRPARDGDLVLDLQTIFANGQAYAISAQAQRVEGSVGHRDASDTAEWLGGGAVLGSIIGAIAGGGKGAAIGAGAGAATGYGAMAYQGRSIRIPAGSRLTFRLDQPLEMRVGRAHNNRGTGTYNNRERR